MAITVGALPSDLTMSSTGLITGTPTNIETAKSTAQVADDFITDTQALSITIAA